MYIHMYIYNQCQTELTEMYFEIIFEVRRSYVSMILNELSVNLKNTKKQQHKIKYIMRKIC